jgi:hypothetical protein
MSCNFARLLFSKVDQNPLGGGLAAPLLPLHQTYSDLWSESGLLSGAHDGASRLTSGNGIGYSEAAVGNTIKNTNVNSGEYWTYTWNDANQLTVAADYQSNGHRPF